MLSLLVAVSGCTGGTFGGPRQGDTQPRDVLSGDRDPPGDAAVGDRVRSDSTGGDPTDGDCCAGIHAPFDLGGLTIPRERLPNWTRAGVEGGIPDTSGWPRVNAVDHDATPNDASDDDADAINAAIAYAADNHARAVVILPAGQYDVAQPKRIELASNVVLQGDGPDQTIIRSVLDSGPSTGVLIGGTSDGSEIPLTGGLEQGSTVLLLSQAPSFESGDFAIVRQDDDNRIASEASSTTEPIRSRIWWRETKRIALPMTVGGESRGRG